MVGGDGLESDSGEPRRMKTFIWSPHSASHALILPKIVLSSRGMLFATSGEYCSKQRSKQNAQHALRQSVTKSIASAVQQRSLSNILGSVVMLNLLIAIMGDTYERVCSTDEFVECIDLADCLQAKCCQIPQGSKDTCILYRY